MFATIFLSFLKNYWKPLSMGLVGLCLAVGGYAFGRYGTPERIVIQEKLKVVEVEKERLVVIEKEVVKKDHSLDEKQRIHREEHEIKHPDGTEERHKTEDINVDTVVRDTEIRYVDKIVEKEVIKYVDREVEKTVDISKPMPDWRIGPMLGVGIDGIASAASTGTFDVRQSIVGGVEVERRILGPISIGAWGLTSGQVGLSASLEF